MAWPEGGRVVGWGCLMWWGRVEFMEGVTSPVYTSVDWVWFGWWLLDLVKISIIFCRLFTIKNRCKKVGFQTLNQGLLKLFLTNAPTLVTLNLWISGSNVRSKVEGSRRAPSWVKMAFKGSKNGCWEEWKRKIYSPMMGIFFFLQNYT